MALIATLTAAWGQAPPRKPNFIVILCDDLGYNDLGVYTYPSMENPGPPPAPWPSPYSYLPPPNPASDSTQPGQTLTPNLDRMAGEGIRFTSFYSSAPVCSPARAALMTGCYPPRVGINNVLNPSATAGLNTTEVTLPEILKNQGYATALVGKWHLGHHPQFLPTRHGFDEYLGLPYSNDMSPLSLYEGEDAVETIGNDPLKQGQLTQRYTARALEFIERNRAGPFFLLLAHNMPHVPVYASEDFVGRSGKGAFYDVVMEIDWSTGQILDKLAQLGLDQDTLVLFTSDNGPWHSRGNPSAPERAAGSAYPLHDSKATTWEGGMRVPCLARWPGRIPVGQVTDEVAGLIDVLPTLTALAGDGPPRDRVVDGRDIQSLLFGLSGARSPREYQYYYKSGTLEAVRWGQWKLRNVSSTTSLFDLSGDIQEMTDLAAANPGLAAQMEQARLDFDAAISSAKRPAGSFSTQEILLNTNRLTVYEGASGAFQIRLAEAPAAPVSVTVSWFSGDASLAVAGAQSFLFDSNNWSDFQAARIAASQDLDTLNGTATFRCAASAFQPIREVFVTELDEDVAPALEVSLTTPQANPARLRTSATRLLAGGQASLNGLTNLPGAQYSWSATPAEGVRFTNPDQPETGVEFSADGDWQVQLVVAYEGMTNQVGFDVQVGVSNSLPTGDLVARLAFDELYGGTAFDATGGGHHATLGGAPAWRPAAGRIGGAIAFHGGNDLATMADSDEINLLARDKRTIALWFKPAQAASAANQVIYEEGGKTRGLILFLKDGLLRVGGWNNGENGWTNTYLTATNPVAADAWHHAALVLDANSAFAANALHGYLDGVRFGSGGAAMLSVHTDDTGIGGIAQYTRLPDGTTPGEGTHSFAGMVDELLVYNRALSGPEIAELARGPVNVVPQVTGGTNQIVRLADGALLVASAVDDGLPSNRLALRWRQVAGPGVTVFHDPLAASTSASFSLPGDYVLRFSADDGEASGCAEVAVTVLPREYAEWSATVSLPPGQTGESADPDGDGLVNFLEFACGLDPLIPNSPDEAIGSSLSVEGDAAVFQFVATKAADRAAELVVQESADLTSWRTIPIAPQATALPNGRVRLTFQGQQPISARQGYLRLGAQSNP